MSYWIFKALRRCLCGFLLVGLTGIFATANATVCFLPDADNCGTGGINNQCNGVNFFKDLNLCSLKVKEYTSRKGEDGLDRENDYISCVDSGDVDSGECHEIVCKYTESSCKAAVETRTDSENHYECYFDSSVGCWYLTHSVCKPSSSPAENPSDFKLDSPDPNKLCKSKTWDITYNKCTDKGLPYVEKGTKTTWNCEEKRSECRSCGSEYNLSAPIDGKSCTSCTPDHYETDYDGNWNRTGECNKVYKCVDIPTLITINIKDTIEFQYVATEGTVNGIVGNLNTETKTSFTKDVSDGSKHTIKLKFIKNTNTIYGDSLNNNKVSIDELSEGDTVVTATSWTNKGVAANGGHSSTTVTSCVLTLNIDGKDIGSFTYGDGIGCTDIVNKYSNISSITYNKEYQYDGYKVIFNKNGITSCTGQGLFTTQGDCETNHPDTVCTQDSSSKCWIGKCDTTNNKYYYESKDVCYERYQDECDDCNINPCEQVDEDTNCWLMNCEKMGMYARESDCKSNSSSGKCTFDSGLGCYMPDEVTCDNNKELYDTDRECEEPVPSNVNGYSSQRYCVYDATTKCYKPKNSSCSDRDLYESEVDCGQYLQGCKPVIMNGITCYMPKDCEDLGYFNYLSACTSKNPSGCIKIEYWEDNLYCYKPKTSSCEIKGGFDDLATCVTNYGKEHCQYDATTKCYIWKSVTYTVKVEGVCESTRTTAQEYDSEECTARISPSNVTSVRAILSTWHAENDWDWYNRNQCERTYSGGELITESGYKWSDESYYPQFANETCWSEGWNITLESFTINGKTVNCPGSITLDNGDTYKCERNQDSGGTQGCCTS